MIGLSPFSCARLVKFDRPEHVAMIGHRHRRAFCTRAPCRPRPRCCTPRRAGCTPCANADEQNPNASSKLSRLAPATLSATAMAIKTFWEFTSRLAPIAGPGVRKGQRKWRWSRRAFGRNGDGDSSSHGSFQRGLDGIGPDTRPARCDGSRWWIVAIDHPRSQRNKCGWYTGGLITPCPTPSPRYH